MNDPALPYLAYLRGTFANLAAITAADPMAAMQNATGSRLIDHMVVQRTVLARLRAESYAAMLPLLPNIEALTGAAPELRQFCAAADPTVFDQFLQCAAQRQRQLVMLDTAAARTLCKSILAIDADYNRQFTAAVLAQEAASTQGSASTARNARSYDEAALLQFIRKTFPDETELTIASSSFVAGGYSKFTMSIRLANVKSLPEDVILRADASATFGGASVAEEYRLLQTLHEHGVHVPKPLAIEETGKVFGSKFMLVEKKTGISIGHMFMLPAPSKSVCRDVAQQLAAIHRIPIAALGGRVSNATGRSSDKALAWLDEGLAAWKPLNMPSPAFETAFEWLRANVALNDQAPRTLVHGDVHLANILVQDDRVSTILDWEFAHLGNPAYDLGYFYDQAIALDSWEAFLDAYGQAGASIPDEAQLNYAVLFAATRLGVMTCQSKHEFTSGAGPGLSGAVVIGSFFYEITIQRITRALDRVL